MIKVLVAALVGTVAGIVVMVVVIAVAGRDTAGASDVGLASQPTVSVPNQTNQAGGGSGPTSGPQGSQAGASLFSSSGCGACHTFKPAGSTGTTGPDLDKLADAAKTAGQPLDKYVEESIVDPNAYIVKGYQANIMPQTFGQSLSQQQIKQLVTYLTGSAGSSS